jgi:hypothetical protein
MRARVSRLRRAQRVYWAVAANQAGQKGFQNGNARLHGGEASIRDRIGSNMRYYQDYKGPDFVDVLNVYRWDGVKTAERWDAVIGDWIPTGRDWWLDRIESGDPTIDEVSESEAMDPKAGRAADHRLAY